MNWIEIKSDTDLEIIMETSFQLSTGVAIFKHSTRCSISNVVKRRLDQSWDFDETLPIFYLDLLQYRAISNLIAEKFNIQHESPQLLIIKNGECIYHESHMNITVKNIHASLEVEN